MLQELDEALVLWVFRHALGSVRLAHGVCRRWRAILPTGQRLAVPDALEADMPLEAAGLEAALRRATECDRVLLLSVAGPSPLPFLLRVLSSPRGAPASSRLNRIVSLTVGGRAWAAGQETTTVLLERVVRDCHELEELALTDVGLAHGGAEVLAAALRGSHHHRAGEPLVPRPHAWAGAAASPAAMPPGGRWGEEEEEEDKYAPANARPGVDAEVDLCEGREWTQGVLHARLKHLRLERNGLAGGPGMSSLAKTIGLMSLCTLELGGNRLGSTGAVALACALEKAPAPSLALLGLAENDLGPEGMRALGPTLSQLQSLARLNLNANRLMAAGAVHLADALRSCASLSAIDLNFNFLEQQGAQSLAPVLGAQTGLTALDLSFNDIGPEGMHALVESMVNEQHVGFVRLDLSKNTLGAAGANALFPLLGRNATTLEQVCLKFNGLGQQHAAMVNCLVPRANVEVLET